MMHGTEIDQNASNELPLPPESLRHRVHGAADAASFLSVGQQCSQDIIAALRHIGRGLGSFESVLDFGCGCGRVLRWLMPDLADTHVFGSDIDRQAVAWCGKNLPGIAFSVNAGLPPTGYAAHSFDLIYAISVFSHLDEDFQFYWLNELRRIAKPNAIILLSLHGSYYLKSLPAETVAEIEAHGMQFVVSGGWQGIFPDWYQIAFHTQEYVFEQFGRYFEVLDYLPGGMNGVQDLVVLRKRSEDSKALDHELALQGELSRLHTDVNAFKRAIETKNQHILRLEQLIKALESGRVMRLLSALTK